MRIIVAVVLSVFVWQAITAPPAEAHPRWGGSVGVSFGVFYDELSPHGEWIAIGGGVYGWRPAGVYTDWRPYTVGRWCWTNYGWYWLSDEPWGWAVFHYGRWYYDDYYGWIWIPGYDWAPAWVEWRYSPDYIGWAPLGPYAVFNISWGVHYRTRWYTPVHWWSFVPCKYVAHPNVHRYVYRTENNTRFIGVTRSGGSVRYEGGRIVSRGPEREYVERRGNVRIEQVRVREVDDRPVERIAHDGSREEIQVYRPRIEKRADEGEQLSRPPRVRDEGGRSLGLDTRKIDLRARELEREEGRDIRRAEEFRSRDEGGRGGRVDAEGRDPEGLYGRPSPGRNRDVDSRARERTPELDRPADPRRGRGDEDIRSNERQTQVRPESERGRESLEQKREERARPNRQPEHEYRPTVPDRRGEMRGRYEPRNDAGRGRDRANRPPR